MFIATEGALTVLDHCGRVPPAPRGAPLINTTQLVAMGVVYTLLWAVTGVTYRPIG